VLIRSYEVPESQIEGIGNMPIPDALRTTSAAPTYFLPVQRGDKLYIDGGMMANNPTEFGIFEAHNLWPDQDINTIVSIGTGIPVAGKGSVNVLRLVDELVNIATDSQLIHDRITEWLKLTQPTPNYFRLSPPGIGSIRLDESSEPLLFDMEKKTNEYMSQPQQLQTIEQFKVLFNIAS